MKNNIQFNQIQPKKRISYFIVLSTLSIMMIMFISQCWEFIEETDEPIQFTDYFEGIDGFGKPTEVRPSRTTNPGQFVSFYAVVEVKKYSYNKEEISIKKEWFKKPDKVRREIIIPGSLPQVYISNGRRTWSFSLVAPIEAYESKYELMPDFFVNKISQESFESLKEKKKVIETEKEYMLEDQLIINDYKTHSKVWLDKTTFLPTRWEQKTFNPNSQLVRDKICNEIRYDISFPERIFQVPARVKIAEQNTELVFSGEMELSFLKDRMDQEDIDKWISTEKDIKRILKMAPDNPEAYCDLGYLEFLKKDYEEAEQFLQRAIELDDKHERSYNTMISICLSRDQKIKAATWIEKYRKACTPESPLDYYVFGSLYEKADFIKESVYMYEQAVKLQKDDTFIDEKTGHSYQIKGLRKKYIEAYENALKKLEKKKPLL